MEWRRIFLWRHQILDLYLGISFLSDDGAQTTTQDDVHDIFKYTQIPKQIFTLSLGA